MSTDTINEIKYQYGVYSTGRAGDKPVTTWHEDQQEAEGVRALVKALDFIGAAGEVLVLRRPVGYTDLERAEYLS